MQAYVDMVKHLDDEIQQIRKHLAQLETARQALAPLTAFNLAPAAPVLPYIKKVQDVTDVVPIEPAAMALPAVPPADASSETPGAVTKRSVRKTAKAVQRMAKKQSAKEPTAAKRAPVDTDLPRTSGEFWLKTMGKGKHTVAAIVDKAMKKLEVSEDKRSVLTNRLNAWLYPSVKAGTIHSPGSNRQGSKVYQVNQ